LIVLKPVVVWLIKICVKRGLAGQRMAWLALAGLGVVLKHFLERDQTSRISLPMKAGDRFSIAASKSKVRTNRRSHK
jgi:hypothetical protein